MGGSVSLVQIPTEVLECKSNGLTSLLTQRNAVATHNFELNQNEKCKSLKDGSRRLSPILKKISKKTVKYNIPPNVNELLQRLDIVNESQYSASHIANTDKLVCHIFECLGALQHLVKADREKFAYEDTETLSETSSNEANKESVGKLLHEMITIYSLCGDTLRVILNASPDAAEVEDNYGRLPLHVAVDRDQPWTDAIESLVLAYPQALNRRDSGGRLPLHIAVDRQIPNAEGIFLR